MNNRITCIFIAAILSSAIAQAQVKSPNKIVEQVKSKITQISVDELKLIINSGKKYILIDVRTEKEYLCGHIKNSTWIPRGKVEFMLQKITVVPQAKIIVYCRSGGRSALSAFALKNIGYEKILNLDGGFRKWVNSGNSVFNIHGEIKIVNFEMTE